MTNREVKMIKLSKLIDMYKTVVSYYRKKRDTKKYIKMKSNY